MLNSHDTTFVEHNRLFTDRFGNIASLALRSVHALAPLPLHLQAEVAPALRRHLAHLQVPHAALQLADEGVVVRQAPPAVQVVEHGVVLELGARVFGQYDQLLVGGAVHVAPLQLVRLPPSR